jgi:TolB-like protein
MAGVLMFDPFELDMQRRELRRDGEVVDVQAKVLDLLAYLVRHRDRAVPKEELIGAVWPDTVVTDAVLTSAVRKARRALGDEASHGGLIRTVHRHGYRFVGEARSLSAADASQAEDANVPSHRPSIAVLPFSSGHADDGQSFLGEAIAADITTLLARHRWLEVIGRSRAHSPEADYLVSGTVQRTGCRLRVTAELDDGTSGRHLWGDIYDRQVDDLFEVQDEITRMVVGRLEPEIGMAERHKVARSAHPDLAAWECFHLGLMHFYRFTAADNAQAQRLLDRSRTLDPDFGEAHAWWAYAVVLGMVYWDDEPCAARLQNALDATQTALDIDGQNAVFYALKARVQLARCEYERAIHENQIAIEMNPTLAVAHCSLGDSLAYEGRYDEALERFESALALSPNDPQRWAFLSYGALALLFKRDFEQALAWARRALEVPNCQYWALAHQVVALAYLERPEELRRAVAALSAARADFSVAFARRKLFFLKREDQIELYLQGLRRAGVLMT